MKEKEVKTPAKTNTGMNKRANPLSLEKESLEKEVVKTKPSKDPITDKPSKPEPKPVTTLATAPKVLTGPKQFALFIPLFNKELMKAIKTSYPDVSYGQLIEKAWLLMLAQEQPKAYEALLVAIANQGKL
jgi:hypothetical protein